MSSAAIIMQGVTKRFRDKTAVDHLDLEVPAGSLCGFLGPNGAGKTTTIRMIMSIFYPDAGRISVLGKKSAVESKDRIGYLPEERGVYRKMRVGPFLNYMGRLKGLPAHGLDQKVKSWLERVGLPDCYKKKSEELSKGMQQKVQYISAVIHEPELIILDEPFSGLDPVNRKLLRTLLEEQHAKGRTIIFSTHAMFEAEQLCDHLFMISRGKKVLDMSVEDVWRTHDPRSVIVETLGSRKGEAGISDAQLTLASIAGVENAMPTARGVELKLGEGVEPASVMSEAARRVSALRIELKRPSLEDIFLDLAGESADGMAPEEEKEAAVATR
ncbi:MAG TPA: ATP-binding cassette domain-containing protein [Phycisphaerales bacterium]|nr:ATP-binding cassette domain-containing protein [Phycisphaerales bacterium]